MRSRRSVQGCDAVRSRSLRFIPFRMKAMRPIVQVHDVRLAKHCYPSTKVR